MFLLSTVFHLATYFLPFSPRNKQLADFSAFNWDGIASEVEKNLLVRQKCVVTLQEKKIEI
jgi:hypothetical protein